MQTFVKSAGKSSNMDYSWWQLSADHSLVNITSITNIIGANNLNLIDEKFTVLLLRKNENLCLLLYLPAQKPIIAKKKSQRIDFTGQRSIRNGFIWLAECEVDNEQLKKLVIGLLNVPLGELIDAMEMCFSFTQEPENQKRLPGFNIDVECFSEVIKKLKMIDVSYETDVIKDDVLQMAHDNPERRREFSARLREDTPLPARELLLLVDYYADPSEIQEKHHDRLWCLLTAQPYTNDWQVTQHSIPLGTSVNADLIKDIKLTLKNWSTRFIG
jgi:hypothetical protein